MKRVALVQEWMTSYAGSERVLEQLIALFPSADVFAVADFLPQGERSFLGGRQPRTSWVQRLPGARRGVQKYLPLMPLAVESLDLSGYDVVISSSHAVAKGVLTGPDQIHLCYCHSPARYAWDLQHQYLRESGLARGWKGMAARAMLHYFRLWDARTANGVDRFIANSTYIARRIRKTYGRESAVLAPPVDTQTYRPGRARSEDYFTASRLVPYKRIDVLVDAFRSLPGRRLLVAGAGPMLERIRATAPENVVFLGRVSGAEMVERMQTAKAFVFAAEEDFGIVMAEAQACGTPVICYGAGGARDIVLEGETGLFFESQTPAAAAAAIRRFEETQRRFDPQRIRANAERFSAVEFRAGFARIYSEATGELPEALGFEVRDQRRGVVRDDAVHAGVDQLVPNLG
ncbi:MAG: glycosyltransferase [Bryobacteraceae bacterium]|nr:glycosyltransferase [Bryobacteraceae bacterium]